eukprot:CAMPEP_0113567946 /NCGR_PEP_ID=MMETSP0015_2-20120614/23562_1 /TAXON_ID=2838 /ORGANISM="Odontella" /LENGTH=389 /DNA_ID=CAMNT_0000470405 /DNA_START=138 /DNA_END=1307 /DNA_ORIENTATION=- /assembly_acc=CAM_ASM_000160
MRSKRRSDKATKKLDSPDSFRPDPESLEGVEHSLPSVSIISVGDPQFGSPGRSLDAAAIQRNNDGDCLPLSSDDVRIDSGNVNKVSVSLEEDGDCLPSSSEDLQIGGKYTDNVSSTTRKCTSRSCGICTVILLVTAALGVGLGLGLSKEGKEFTTATETWASKYLPGFPGSKDVTEDTAGKRSDPSFENRGTITLTSPAFEYGEPIPIRYTAGAGDVSPPLDWSSVPEGTEDVVIICEDVDFPHPDHPASEPFVHWLAFGVDSKNDKIPDNIPKEKEIDSISGTDPTTGESYSIDMFQGVTSYGVSVDESAPDNARIFGWGYYGPDPTKGHPPHRYYFRILALDGRIKDHFPSDGLVVSMEEVKGLIDGDDSELNVLDHGVLMGTYQKA